MYWVFLVCHHGGSESELGVLFPPQVLSSTRIRHYENTPIHIYRKFHLPKLKKIRLKNSDVFHISAQNIDCGYSLEPPR